MAANNALKLTVTGVTPLAWTRGWLRTVARKGRATRPAA